jgi:hypothetical protein
MTTIVQNRYCCRCQQTTRFEVSGTRFRCTVCGVLVDKGENPRDKSGGGERSLIGNPFRSFKTSFA